MPVPLLDRSPLRNGKLGCETSLGSLAEGWRFHRDTAAYVIPYAGPGGLFVDQRPASPDEVWVRLAEAMRYRDMAA